MELDFVSRFPASISPQEQTVLVLRATGNSRKETASIMGISENTVKTYISRLHAKLGRRCMHEAALLLVPRPTLQDSNTPTLRFPRRP